MTKVGLYTGAISLADLRESRLGTPAPPGKASDVGSRRGVCLLIGPMLFNKRARLNAYADDHQIYYSHLYPVVLDTSVSHNVRVPNQWYHENGMLVMH